jgi:DNA polymerase-1
MRSKRETIFVPDGPWYLHRIFFTTKTNRPLTEVIPYRLLSMICKDALAVRANYVCCAFDGPDVFRYKVYPLYKGERKGKAHAEPVDNGYSSSASELDVYDFLDPIYQLFSQIGMGFYQPKKYEADDVLCSIARKYGDRYRVICGTSDKDAYQYLTEYVSLYDSSYKDPQTKEAAPRFITVADAEARKGVRVDQMVDYQTLIGDKGDSIPAIKGYGPVTAKKLLEEHGTLQAWYKQSTGKERRFIQENLELFRRNRKLVQLVDTCAPPSDVDEWKLYKEKPVISLPGPYHDLHSVMYPKTKGLFR